MKEAMNTNQVPSPEILTQWAESGDVPQIAAALANLHGREEDKDAVIGRVVAAGIKIELGDTFNRASQDLEAVYAQRPAVARDDGQFDEPAEPIEPATLAELIGEFGETINGYLQNLGPNVDAACSRTDRLKKLQTVLSDAERQGAALKQLAAIGEVTPEWLTERAHQTVAGVKENLWEVVQTGVDTAAFTDQKTAAEIVPYIEDWRQSIDDGFELARTDLREATDWLNGDK